MKCVVSIDVGGTTTRVSLVSLATGAEISRQEFRTNPDSYSRAFNQVIEAIYDLAGNVFTPVSVGVAVAGMVKDGVIIGAGNLPAWVDQEHQEDLKRRLHLPVVVMNDAEAAALGEYTVFGHSMVYVIWGTGVGGAVVTVANDSPVVYPTELGHITVDQSSVLKCGCGGYGHLEALVSGANIPNQFNGLKAENLGHEEWCAVLRHMAVGVRSVGAVFMETPVVFGGGIAVKQLKQAGWLPVLQKMVDELPSTCPAPRLYISKHGEDSGLVGAAAAARRLVTT